MSQSVALACAPCCWGVDDVTNSNLPPWEAVLDGAQKAGFCGLELGPYGYMPLDTGRVTAALQARGLSIVAGTIFDDLVNPSNRKSLLRQTDEICAFLTALPAPVSHDGKRFAGPYLTVMDWGHETRDYSAGHSDRAPRLSHESWRAMIDTICAIATRARDRYGVRATIHPHAGGYIEFADELARLVEDIPSDVAGLCLDTGHLAYAGMDPVATLRAYADRLDYLHFKDIDPQKFARIKQMQIRFFDACAEGVMCPIGRGSLDYRAISEVLREIDYRGFITIEQERDPSNSASVLSDLLASRTFLRDLGFEREWHDQTT